MAKATILIAEDDALIAAHLESLLTVSGYTVLPPVAFGAEAVEAALAHVPDVVLMDIQLADDVDGVAAAGQIQAQHDIPVVYLTAYTQDARLEQARTTNPYAYLAKPISGRELLATIDMVLYRHAADRRLKESEAKYRTLVENIPGAVYSCEVNPPWRVHQSGGDVHRFCGWPAEDFATEKRVWTDLIVPEDLRSVEEAVADAVATHRPFSIEYRIYHADGSLRWVHEIGQCVYAADGTPLRLDGINLDVTERKRAELALRESETRFRAILDNTPDLAWLKDRAGRYTAVNQAFADAVGYGDPAQLVGLADGDVWPGEEYARFERDDAAVMADRCEVRVEETVMIAGECRSFDTLKRPLFDARGDVIGTVGIARDITERKRAERALAESEAKYRTLVENIPGAVYRCQAEAPRRALVLSEAVLAISGRPAADFTTDEALWTELILPEDLARTDQVLAAALEARTAYSNEYRIRHADGSLRWVYDSGRFTFDAQGRPERIEGVVLDVTERKQVEVERDAALEARRESEDRYRRIVETANEGIWTVDADGCTTYVNPRMAEMLGYAVEELLSRPVTDFLFPEGRVVFAQMLERRRHGLSDRFERRFRCRDGSVCWVNVAAAPLHDAAGTFIGAFSMITDISESKALEAQRDVAHAALAESEAKYRTLVENIPGVVCTSEVNPPWRALHMNEEALALTGRSAADFLAGRINWADILVPEDLPGLVQVVAAAEAVRQPFSTEYRIRHADGSLRWVQDVGRFTYGGDGTPLRLDGVNYDVTERKRVEVERDVALEARRESEASYRRIVETASEGIWVVDPANITAFVNQRLADLLGYTVEEMVGRPTLMALLPEDVADQQRRLDERRRGLEERYEQRYRRKDGSAIWLAVSAAPIVDASGAFAGSLGMFTDISARKAAEAERDAALDALRRREAYLTAIIENLPGVVWLKDTQGRFLALNRGHAVPNGLDTPEHLVGQTDRDILPPEQAARYQAEDAAVMASGQPLRVEEQIVDRGEVKWIEKHKTPIRDADGAIIGTTGYSHDVTEFKRAVDLARRQEAYLRAIIDNLPGVVWLKDAEGRFLAANRGDWSLPGVDRGEPLIGKTDFDCVPLEMAARFAGEDAAVMMSGEPLRVVERVVDNGEVRWFEKYKKPIRDAEGTIIGTTGYSHDATALKWAEEDRLQLERRLLQAEKQHSLAVLAGGIARDYNDRLQAILGDLDLALRDIAAGSDMCGHVESAIQTTWQAADLTHQLLAYAGQGESQVGCVDLSRLLEETGRSLGAAVGPHVTLTVAPAAGLPTVEADAAQLRQVLVNLVTNAAEAIGDAPGKVTLTTGVLDCAAPYLGRTRLEEKPPAGRYVYLEVADTGCGMDAPTLQRLFDPFFTTRAPGRGLGMPAVAGIVRAHHGAIIVDSAVGTGTTVRLLFPLPLPATAGAAPPLLVALEAPPGGRVLVVDHDEQVRRVVTEWLSRLGYDVLTAVDGAEALQLVRTHATGIACVLLDLTVPGLDGVATNAELRRLRPGLPVILSSGYSEAEARVRFEGGGLAGFLRRPYAFEALRAVLEQALQP